jgi:LysR family transcriptional activator of glutamate synthase operon
MELNQLKYFVTIAETLNFTRAADILCVSQPALSYQIKRLESELGTKLFERQKRGVVLSPDGELFLPLAQAVLLRADEAVRVLREHLGVEAGEVRVGCNPTVATYLMPPLLASFRVDYPRVKVSLLEAGDVELQRRVLEGDIGFAVVAASAPGSPDTFDVVPLASERLLLALPLDHPLAPRRKVALRELAEEEFVFPADSFRVTLQFIDACRRAGFEPKVAYQTGSFESAKGFVRQGLCAAVLPQMALGMASDFDLAMVDIEGGVTRQLSLIRDKNHSLTGVTRALIAHILENADSMLARRATRSLPDRV